jgi:light-regulated signal transduction histidine kinase (bacteriophytochrome)
MAADSSSSDARSADALRAAAAEGELDALATALSHDLRAPLRAIDGFSRILLDPERTRDLPPDTRRFLALVRDAGSELAELLDDLVDIVRAARVPLDVRDVDPGPLARELIEAVFNPRADGAAVEWVVAVDVPRCRADQRLLRRLLEELLDNALKFGARRIELTWDPDARAYAVSDDGIGLAGALPDQALAVFGRLHGREDYPGRAPGWRSRPGSRRATAAACGATAPRGPARPCGSPSRARRASGARARARSRGRRGSCSAGRCGARCT